MLKTTYIRDGKNQIIGSMSGFPNGDTVARDRDGKILGRSSELFHTTRDAGGISSAGTPQTPGCFSSADHRRFNATNPRGQ